MSDQHSHLVGLTLAALLVMQGAATAAESYDSPSGKVRIAGSFMDDHHIAVGSDKLPIADDYTRAWLAGRRGNLILVGMSSGGNACPALYAWLDTTPDRVRLTKAFGSCSDLIEIDSDSETVTVTMPSMIASRGRVAFDFDGERITERVLGLEPSGVTGEGPDAWIGKSAYAYLTAPENESALIALMGWEALDAARSASAISSDEQAMCVDGEWIVASGCQPHACHENSAAVALHRDSGALVVALKLEDQAGRLFGQPSIALPPALRAVLTGG